MSQGFIESLRQELASHADKIFTMRKQCDEYKAQLADERAKVARLEAEVGSLRTCNEELEKAVNNSDRVRARQGRALNQLSAENARLRAALKEAREAMEERRLYGDAWEYKHGKRWDKEDAAIDAVIQRAEEVEE